MAGNVVTNLIVFHTNTAYSSTGQTAAVDVTSATNYVDLTGGNGGGAPEPFPHPNPTAASLLDDYWVSIGHSIVNNGGRDFLAACAGRAGRTWDTALSATAVNDYIRIGLGQPAL